MEGWVKKSLGMFKFRSEHPHIVNPCGLMRERGGGDIDLLSSVIEHSAAGEK